MLGLLSQNNYLCTSFRDFNPNYPINHKSSSFMRTKLHRRSLILWGMLLMLTATALPQLQAQQPVITIKTTKQKGESIKLSINANGAVSVIGAEEISGDKYNKVYSVEAEDGSITIIGDVTKLDCSNNQLTELNVSQNELLKTINCYNNQIEQLDLSNNKNLTFLNCGYNRLSELKLENLTKLSSLDCASNQLTHLDLSQNAELLILACSHNQLTSLDLSHNTKLNHIDCLVNQIKDVGMDKLVQSLPDRKGMQSGTIIAIAVYSDKEGNVCSKDQVATAKERGWIVKTDQGQEYPGCSSITIKTTKQKGESIKLSINANGAVSVIGAEEISGDKYNKVYSVEAEDGSITIIGDVTELDCSNNQLTELNVSQNELLKTINCYNNQIEQLDLSNNKNLTFLNCGYNRLSELKLENLTKLSSLDCASNQLTHLDLSQNRSEEHTSELQS